MKVISRTMAIISVIAALTGTMLSGQTSGVNTDLVSLLNGSGLTPGQKETVLDLTKKILTEIGNAGKEITEILTVPDPNSKASADERIAVIQKRFGIKLETYGLDLADAIGEANASKVKENIRGIIPQVLLAASEIASASHGSMQGMNMETSVPGTTGADAMSGMGNAGNVAAIGSASMNTMPGMTTGNATAGNATGNTIPGMNMNTPGLTGNTGTGSMQGTNMQNGMGMQNANGKMPDPVNNQMLIQLLSYNTMLVQMLYSIQAKDTTGNTGSYLQPIFQLINNQTSLIQMLMTNNNSSASGSSGMAGMGMM